MFKLEAEGNLFIKEEEDNKNKDEKTKIKEKEYVFAEKFKDESGNVTRVHYEIELPGDIEDEVEISVETKDQGWASNDSSGSWVAAKLLSNDLKTKYAEVSIHHNVKVKHWTWRKRVFNKDNESKYDQEFFKNLKKGYKLQIIGNSRYPGWKIHLNGVKIKLRGILI